MTRTQAAEILATYINVQARKFGRTRVDKDFIEVMRTQAIHAGGQITKAAQVCPHWTTIRTAGRRNNQS